MAAVETLPDDVRRLIESSVPTLEALEIVLLLARDPGRVWSPGPIVQMLQPSKLSEAEVREYLIMLSRQGLLTDEGGVSFTYAPDSAALTKAVEGLLVAYHQRPVTLIRTIYANADLKNIRSFADAFRLKKDR